jgi:dTDP-4-dehydrorhamnose reductase
MKVLITGAEGQVGRALVRCAPELHTIEAYGRAQLDLSRRTQVATMIGAVRPDVVINAAAFTAVDKAETDRDAAFAINAAAVESLAVNCAEMGARLLHLSTDYVFDGESIRAYEVDAPTRPVNAYGESKLAGERAIAAVPNLFWTMVRTSWVYAPWGNSFPATMLRLMRERGAVSVVSDQIGAPTSALSLARFLWRAIAQDARGILHYTDAGVASWYDFAAAIGEEALAMNLIAKSARIHPIPTSEYPTPAKRPAFSLLATRSSLQRVGFDPPHWREALREVLRATKP